jgi:hypothetical protein
MASDDDSLFDMGFHRISTLQASIGVDWLYDGLIPRASFGVLVGESGIGKSTLAIDLASALGTTTPFAGYEYGRDNEGHYQASDGTLTDVLLPSGTIYIHGEGNASLDARFVAAYETRKAIYSDIKSRAFDLGTARDLPILQKNMMCTSEGDRSLRSTIKRLIDRGIRHEIWKNTNVSTRLIIVDTLVAVAGIQDGNSNGIVQDRVNCLKELGELLDATVLVTAHTKKGTKEIVGATSLFNASDFVFRIDKTSKPGILSLVHDKLRHGPKQPDKHFKLSPFNGDASLAGGKTPPLIVEWLDETNSQQCQAAAQARHDASAEGSLAVHTLSSKEERDSDVSGFDVYMEAAQLAVMGQGKSDALDFMWTTLEAVRGEFDRMYQRNAEANRKAFERAHKRAMAEGKVVVSTADHRRQLVRIVE